MLTQKYTPTHAPTPCILWVHLVLPPAPQSQPHNRAGVQPSHSSGSLCAGKTFKMELNDKAGDAVLSAADSAGTWTYRLLLTPQQPLSSSFSLLLYFTSCSPNHLDVSLSCILFLTLNIHNDTGCSPFLQTPLVFCSQQHHDTTCFFLASQCLPQHISH